MRHATPPRSGLTLRARSRSAFYFPGLFFPLSPASSARPGCVALRLAHGLRRPFCSPLGDGRLDRHRVHLDCRAPYLCFQPLIVHPDVSRPQEGSAPHPLAGGGTSARRFFFLFLSAL